MKKPDLDSKEHIARFVDAFYEQMLNDKQLAPIFLDIANIDLNEHLPLIRSYWEKLLLGDKSYQRHTMNIHRAVNAKRALTQQDFNRWLVLFTDTVDEYFAGEKAERAKRVAGQIAVNMYGSMSVNSR